MLLSGGADATHIDATGRCTSMSATSQAGASGLTAFRPRRAVRKRRPQSVVSKGKSINLMQTVPSVSTYPLSYL
jgi:hypothetical protein